MAAWPSIDISRFQITPEPEPSDDPAEREELARLAAELAAEAEVYIRSFHWTPPIRDMPLAFGIGKVIGLYLARFERPIEGSDDSELWIVAGDMPPAYFATDYTSTPADALEAYCELMQDWADAVIAGDGRSQVYPVAVAPTQEHADMLSSRVAYIRRVFVPLAEDRARRKGSTFPRLV